MTHSDESERRVVRLETLAPRRQRVRAVVAVSWWWLLSVAVGNTWNGRATDYLAGFFGGIACALLWRYDDLIWRGVHRVP